MKEIDKLYMIHDYIEFLIEHNLRPHYDTINDFLTSMYYEIQDYKEANEVEFSEDEMKRELEKFILLFK